MQPAKCLPGRLAPEPECTPALNHRRGGPAEGLPVCPGGFGGGLAASGLTPRSHTAGEAAPGKMRTGPGCTGKGGGETASPPGQAPCQGGVPAGQYLAYDRSDPASCQAGEGLRLPGPRRNKASTSKPPQGSVGADQMTFDLEENTHPAKLCTLLSGQGAPLTPPRPSSMLSPTQGR